VLDTNNPRPQLALRLWVMHGVVGQLAGKPHPVAQAFDRARRTEAVLHLNGRSGESSAGFVWW
jgi:hypothetical protein